MPAPTPSMHYAGGIATANSIADPRAVPAPNVGTFRVLLEQLQYNPCHVGTDEGVRRSGAVIKAEFASPPRAAIRKFAVLRRRAASDLLVRAWTHVRTARPFRTARVAMVHTSMLRSTFRVPNYEHSEAFAEAQPDRVRTCAVDPPKTIPPACGRF